MLFWKGMQNLDNSSTSEALEVSFGYLHLLFANKSPTTAHASPMGCAAGPGPRPASWKRFWEFLKAAKRSATPTFMHISTVYMPAYHTGLLTSPTTKPSPLNPLSSFRNSPCPVCCLVLVCLTAYRKSAVQSLLKMFGTTSYLSAAAI